MPNLFNIDFLEFLELLDKQKVDFFSLDMYYNLKERKLFEK